jgi:hypothetical protein
VTGTFTLATGGSLASGSGSELGGVAGLYGAGVVFPVELTPIAGTDDGSLEVEAFFIPEIELPFGGDVFSFQLLAQGVPTQAFALTLAMPGGHLNPSLIDPALAIRMSRTFDGAPAGTGDFSLALTTGQIQTPQCGGTPPSAIAGVPLNLETGAVELVGAACIQTFAGVPLGALFRIRLIGALTLAPAAVPTLSPAGLLTLAAATFGIAGLGLRVAPAGSRRGRRR